MRRPTIARTVGLAGGGLHRRKEIVEAEFVATLRRVCEWSDAAAWIANDDRDVVEWARRALDWLGHEDMYPLS